MTLYPRSRFLRRTVYFVCILLALVALDMLWAQSRRAIHPRYDITRIVEPTLKDGSVDYLAAIENYFSRGVTPENNFVPLMFEAVGRVALPKTQPPDGITSRLGMPHLPETGDYFVNYGDYTKTRTGKEQSLDSDAADISTVRSSPMVKDWLSANEKPLAKIRQASLRTRYFIPFNGGNRPDVIVSVLLPHIKPLRELGEALSMRSRVRLDAGDVAGAREDALTMHRVARALGQAPTLVERGFAIATETLACETDRAMAATGKLSSQDLRSYAAELAHMPDLDGAVAAIDIGERSMVLDATQHLARLGPVESGRLYRAIANDGSPPAPWLFPFLPIPYEQSMIDANAWYDGLVTAFRQPTYALRRDAVVRWEKGIDEVSRNTYLGICSADWALRIFMPSLDRFQTKWENSRAEMRLTQLSLLLAAYKQDHNAYPAALSELPVESDKALPIDNFTDHPFLYTRTATGYTLYTPGPNLIDDSGGNDDIAVSPK